MSVKVYITIDTEEDQWGEYASARTSVCNVDTLPVLQALFDRYGAIPTYLVNYPVATGDRSRGVIREILDSGRCGLGTHCHPWNTPPLKERISSRNSMLCNLPHDLIREKIHALHNAIIDAWGVTPVCFRSGRWSFGEPVARCIHELGYRIDTSISPFQDWSECGGPDFSRASTDEYLFKPESILSADPDGCLREVPPTVGFIQSDFRRCSAVRQWIISKGILHHPLLGMLDNLRLLNLRWLSPELSSGRDMISLARTFVGKGCSFLNMSFHSPSIVPGLGPFVRTPSDRERFMMSLEMFLVFAHENDFEFASLDSAQGMGRKDKGFAGIV